MPVISFTSENKVKKSNFDYPKMKLAKDESIRIALLDNPVMEYVHTLQEPIVVNGVPQTEQKTTQKGDTYEAYKKKFLSRPICLGDASTLQEKGSDPAHCPMCAAAKENADLVSNPQRRYAVHVVKYKTKAGSTNQLAAPYSVDIEVWSFTDRMLNILIDAQEEWAEDGGLKKHDLLLGPCENAVFQKFDVRVAPKAFWLSSAETKAHTQEALENGRIEDLSVACGSNKERKWVEQDIEQIREAWGQIYAYEKRTSDVDVDDDPVISDTSISEDLSSIMDDVDEVVEKPKAKKAAKVEEDDDLDFDSLLDGLDED